jgi:hypothetical protein
VLKASEDHVSPNLLYIFDEAYSEVVNILEHGIWRKFLEAKANNLDGVAFSLSTDVHA